MSGAWPGGKVRLAWRRSQGRRATKSPTCEARVLVTSGGKIVEGRRVKGDREHDMYIYIYLCRARQP